MKKLLLSVTFAAACFGAENSDIGQVHLSTISEKDVSTNAQGLVTENSTGKPVTAVVVYLSLIDGKIESTCDYQNGLRDGFQRVYNSDGKEVFTGQWKHGKTDGPQTEFYPNGKKLREYDYSGGQMNGEYFEWHANGQRKISGHYAGSKKVGRWSHYGEEGTINEVLNFQNGVPASSILTFEEIEKLYEITRAERERVKKEREKSED